MAIASPQSSWVKDKPKKVDTSKAIHFIELGTFKSSVPVKLVELMREIGDVSPIRTESGSVYYTTPFLSEKEAAKQLPKFVSLGFDQARHVVQYKNDLFSLREFNYMVEGGKIKDDSEIPVIRIWK
ncbi:MAG: hypothetical protein BM555_06065 [Crocinitomix sp. MedPE-SWsnd]|nr:MAG: hypothetical protein BM555_06065 [Crocinitomix sp. MedPE-SWsnd]